MEEVLVPAMDLQRQLMMRRMMIRLLSLSILTSEVAMEEGPVQETLLWLLLFLLQAKEVGWRGVTADVAMNVQQTPSGDG
jgi:hypothetical protein